MGDDEIKRGFWGKLFDASTTGNWGAFDYPERQARAWGDIWERVPTRSQVADWVNSVPHIIAEATNWPELEHWAEWGLGWESFNVGVGVGIAEGIKDLAADILELGFTLVKFQLKLLELQKDFVFAGLYKIAHGQDISFWNDPRAYTIHETAVLANRLMGHQLEESDRRITELMKELATLFEHPSQRFKNALAELYEALKKTPKGWGDSWHKYVKLSQEHKLMSQYQAGRWREERCLK